MGEVFLADDTILGRKVALKLLPPRAAEDDQARRRLLQEAQAAAALDHPNICAIYEMKTVEDCTFIAMQYIEGEDLAARLRRGPFPLSEALAFGVQIADALAEAHGRGIVHRDIKPHNIMITPRGQAKLLDFGLAQLRRADAPAPAGDSTADTQSRRLTKSGSVVGTPAYMSPEQLRGAELDASTDIFSLAVVLFEMLAGARPFSGDSAADTVAAILTSPLPPLSAVVPGASDQLDRLLAKALAKDRAERYQTAADLLVDLRAVLRTVDSGIASTPTLASPVATEITAIAVLPFVDLSAEQDQQYLCDGMAEEVINALAQLPGLRVACRSSAFYFRGRDTDIREIGARLKVGAVLEASVRRAGSRLRVLPRLNSVQDGFTLGSDRFDGEIRDVFDIQDEIARAIVAALKLHLSGERPGTPRAVRRTESVEAYQLYLKGLYHWNRRLPQDIRLGLEYFQKSLAEDPGYAPAYSGMAACYIAPAYYGAAAPGTVIPLGRAAAEKALQVDDGQAEAHATLGMIAAIHDFEWLASDRYFRRAMTLNPASPTAFMWHALFNLAPRARIPDALRSGEHAVELDPLNPAANGTLGAVLYYAREPDRAVAQLARTLELQEDFPIAHYYLGKACTARGDHERAAAALERARALLGNSPAVAGALARCRSLMGATEEARRIRSELLNPAVGRYVPAQSLAEAHLGLGEHDAALECLERACDERSALLLWLQGDVLYDPVRSHPRFAALLKRMALD
jgi:TolB-like protein/Tfp pilus assembly protein PilF